MISWGLFSSLLKDRSFSDPQNRISVLRNITSPSQLLFPRKFILSQISPPISKHPVYRSLSVVQRGKRDEPADSRRRTNERTIRTEGNNERTQRTVQV